MGQIIRCPLTETPCSRPISVEEKSFFLAETEKPENDRTLRKIAITEALGDQYQLKSALDEKGINAFTCKICEMIQTCAYGIADVTKNNPNVMFELGIMIALGKPTIILKKRNQRLKLNLPADLRAIEVVPFTEYVEIIPQIKQILPKLPAPISPTSPIEDLERIKPQFAKELRKMEADIVTEFKESIAEAKLDTISFREEKTDVPPELNERLRRLEEKLEEMTRLGFPTDAETASSRAYYFYNQGKYEESLASLNWFLELKPDNPGTLNDRGLTYRLLGRYNQSLADLSRSLELQPDDPATLMNRGNTYAEMRRYDEALADVNRSLELRPDYHDTLNSRAIIYKELERYDEAFADLNRALELKPDDACILYNLACLFSHKSKPDKALHYLKKAIDKDKEFREKAKTDKDFDNIRDDPRFKKLTE